MDKKLVIIMLLAVAFVIGLKCGENHVIRHQSISQTEYGYEVDFDGEIYEYDWGLYRFNAVKFYPGAHSPIFGTLQKITLDF